MDEGLTVHVEEFARQLDTSGSEEVEGEDNDIDPDGDNEDEEILDEMTNSNEELFNIG